MFTAIKMMNNTTKIFTDKEKVFDHPDSFSEEQDYTEYLPSHKELVKTGKFLYATKWNNLIG